MEQKPGVLWLEFRRTSGEYLFQWPVIVQ